MKYRHARHAGNFADVHKHVTLLALLDALQRKEKGFLYVDTHAGRGLYDLPEEAGEWRGGIGRLVGVDPAVPPPPGGSPEIDAYVSLVAAFRRARGASKYPGSPLLAAQLLRPQDRGVAVELLADDAAALREALAPAGRVRAEAGNGFERLRALLPPPERRGLVLIDPPYEETQEDFARVAAALEDALVRFETGVLMAWYPIKLHREAAAWQARLEARIARPLLHSELRLHAADSRVSLNGSGLVIVNPPYLVAERMRLWLPALHERLAVDPRGGTAVRSREGRT